MTRPSDDWDIFVSALAATVSQIPDETTLVNWGVEGGPRFDTTRTRDGKYAAVVDATEFPDSLTPRPPAESGWHTPYCAPAQGSLFELARDSAKELAEEMVVMLTGWAQISDPAPFLSPSEERSGDVVVEEEEFTGRVLHNGLQLRDEIEALFPQLDTPAFRGPVPGAYAVFIAEMFVDLYIAERGTSVQLTTNARRDFYTASEGESLASTANSIARYARFHYDSESDLLMATWLLDCTYYSPRSLMQGIHSFVATVHTVCNSIPPSAPGSPVEWTLPKTPRE